MKQDSLSQERFALFDQLSLVMAMHGQPADREIYRLLQPLLNGSVHYEEHRAVLEKLIESVTHE